MEEKGIKMSLVGIQSFIVVLLGHSLSFVRETEIVNTSVIILFILHFFVFYISDYGHEFFKRGYLAEVINTIKYTVFFALAISISNFFLEERFSISRRGMIYFLTIHFILLYLLNICIKYYSKRIFPNFKGSKKIFLITATSRVEKVMDKLLDAGDFFGELVAVSVLDKPDFQHNTVTVVPVEAILNFATHEVVDEVFINLPSEEYDIGEFISRFETMGIDVTVNLNAFNNYLGSDKKIRGMAGLNVITFSTKFYKTSHVI
ncbi:nucleoside-diphosphate sugar epimerase/dehydratase, partial [Streptococcus oralis]|uniref:nucleoside-diphosphate sugar epimerase/dehydratase n=1 Tax=Streptococcus oralis TaxID=1303 RepID=UPI003D69F279